MKFRKLAALSILAGTLGSIGFASPALAADDITQNAVGTYQLRNNKGKVMANWVLAPCQDNADQCVTVTEYKPKDTAQAAPQWSANAYWTVGSWNLVRPDVPEALTCKDDTTHNLPVTYSWDAATNEGYRSFIDPGLCNGKTKSFASRIELTRTGPAN